jgi:hypothetical protein
MPFRPYRVDDRTHLGKKNEDFVLQTTLVASGVKF